MLLDLNNLVSVVRESTKSEAPEPLPADIFAEDGMFFTVMNRMTKQAEQDLADLQRMLNMLQANNPKPETEPKPLKERAMPTISDECQGVLNECVMTETSVTLPDRNLGPQLYAQVKKVLLAAGGRWKGKGIVGSFLFDRDPRPDLLKSQATGKIASTKKDTQAFYTPKAVVNRVLAHLPADLTGKRILEPSAGSGAFALALKELGALIDCIELDETSCGILDTHDYEAVDQEDFMQVQPPPVGVYDYVVMNPPYTKDAGIKHTLHALRFVKRGGKVYSILPAGVDRYIDSGQKVRRSFAAIFSACGKVVEKFEAGAFKESGTMVPTVLVELTA